MLFPSSSRLPVAHRFFLIAALAVLGVAMAVGLFVEHVRLEQKESERLTMQAVVVRRNIESNLESLNVALQDIVLRSRRSGSVDDLNRYLAAMSDGMPSVRTLSVFDSSGRVLAASRNELAGPFYGESAYFYAIKGRPVSDLLYISRPFRTVLGIHTLKVSRIRAGPQGRFEGIVTATLDPSYFLPLLDSIRYAPDLTTALIHGDGEAVITRPPENASTVERLAGEREFALLLKERKNTGTAMNVRYASRDHVVAMSTVSLATIRMDNPLIVAVDRDRSAVFADWRRDVRMFSGLYAAVLVTSLLLFRSYRKHLRKANERAAQAVDALRESEWKLKTIIENEPECVALLSADGRIRQMNPAGVAMLGAESEAKVKDAFLHAMAAPSFREEVEKFIGGVSCGAAGEITFEAIGYGGDHRWLECRAVPMRDRNNEIVESLCVMRDITARRQFDEQMAYMAHTDSLTELANRRHFMAQAEQEIARIRRYGGSLSLLMIDIDHFKKVNDTYGHKTGDLAIRRLADLCRRTLRTSDIAGRIGGEEFAVLLPETDIDHARHVAEMLRSRVETSDVDSGKGKVQFTISIGMASRDGGARLELESLLGEADAALYQAKENGRNRVCEYRFGTRSR